MGFDVRLDSTGDLPEVTSFIDGPELTTQRARIRLQTFYGEWILDRFKGLPFEDWRRQKPPDEVQIAGVVIGELSSTPGIVRVDSYTTAFDPATRTLSITGDAWVEDGTEETGEVPVSFLVSIGNRTPVVVAFYGSRTIARL